MFLNQHSNGSMHFFPCYLLIVTIFFDNREMGNISEFSARARRRLVADYCAGHRRECQSKTREDTFFLSCLSDCGSNTNVVISMFRSRYVPCLKFIPAHRTSHFILISFVLFAKWNQYTFTTMFAYRAKYSNISTYQFVHMFSTHFIRKEKWLY